MIAIDVLESQIQMAEDRVKGEATPDNKNGTRNTEKGKELYFGIESVLEEL